jgi:hypothetical protein
MRTEPARTFARFGHLYGKSPETLISLNFGKTWRTLPSHALTHESRNGYAKAE